MLSKKVKSRIISNTPKGLFGINIGPNKNSSNRNEDYLIGLRKFHNLADYLTINISSPNTPGLRELQIGSNLEKLLENINDEKFRCLASFNNPENGLALQTDIPNELTFTFKQKGSEGPAGCNDLNQTKLRKCWELETPLPANAM